MGNDFSYDAFLSYVREWGASNYQSPWTDFLNRFGASEAPSIHDHPEPHNVWKAWESLWIAYPSDQTWFVTGEEFIAEMEKF